MKPSEPTAVAAASREAAAASPSSPPPSPASSASHTQELSPQARRRAFLGQWGVPLLGLLASLIVTIRTHSFFMLPYATPVSNDEGYLAAMALRMVRGSWLPYVDGVSQRGPILYWLTTAVMRVGGLWSWVPMRLLGLAFALAIVGLTFRLTAAIFSPMAAGLAAMAATYLLSYELPPWDGVGVNGEPLAVIFALWAALMATRLQTRNPPRRDRLLFWTGVVSACAGLSKQMFMLHAVPVGLWILIGPVSAPTPSRRERLREALIFTGGAVVPFALVVGLYAATGHLREFVYYFQRYGREIFMDPLTRDYIRDKVREEIDRYYFAMATIAAVWLFAVARALRASMADEPPGATPSGASAGAGDDDDASDSPVAAGYRAGAAEGEGGAARPPWAPEAHALLSVPVPGLGLYFVPRRRGAALLIAGAAVVLVAARAAMRLGRGAPYDATALTSDLGLWVALGVLAAVATGLVLVRDYPAARWDAIARLRTHAVPWFAIAQMVCAFAGACFTFRFFPHYFVEFFPFAAVVIGGVAAASFEKLTADDRPSLVSASIVMVGGVVLLAIANSALYRNVRLRRETDRWYQDPATDPIVRYVLEKTRPDQTIFVWGFRAETYLSAHRYPGSRYVYTVYPAGVVPWFQATHEEEERRVVPGSREQLLEDLEREQPELVIDAGRSMNGRYMYNYPMLRTYLDRKYCFMKYVDGEPVYRRRHGERCPPADY